jgi:hypothetical protein
MTMGHTGMDMGRMAEVMPMPPNSIPMKGAVGPFGDYISMGGMFTIIKVRDRLASYDEDPGWYQHPPRTVALKASAEELLRDGIDVHAPTSGTSSSTGRKPQRFGEHAWIRPADNSRSSSRNTAGMLEAIADDVSSL